MTTTQKVSLPRCLVCDKSLSLVACFDGWCDVCAGKALSALLALRDGDVGAAAAWFEDRGVPFLSRVVVGVMPFEVGDG